jgi:hypothetical protein
MMHYFAQRLAPPPRSRSRTVLNSGSNAVDGSSTGT